MQRARLWQNLYAIFVILAMDKYYYRYYRSKKKIEALQSRIKELESKDKLRVAYFVLLRMLVTCLSRSEITLSKINVTPEMITTCRKALEFLAKKDKKENYEAVAPFCMRMIEALERRMAR